MPSSIRVSPTWMRLVTLSWVLTTAVTALQPPSSPRPTRRRRERQQRTTTDVPFTTTTDRIRSAVGTVAVAASLLLGTPVLPATAEDRTTTTAAVHVDFNVPSWIRLVNTEEARRETSDRIAFVADVLRRNVWEPLALDVSPPSDARRTVSEALRGRATVTINGRQDVVVQVIGSDPGSLTVQIRNPLIPRLPFVGFPQTPPVVNAVAAPVVERTAEPALHAVQRLQRERVDDDDGNGNNFWTAPLDGWVVNAPGVGVYRPLSRLDLLGGASLTLGTAYGGSYAFYVHEQRRERLDAAAKKAARRTENDASAATTTEDAASPKTTQDDGASEKASDETAKSETTDEKVNIKEEESSEDAVVTTTASEDQPKVESAPASTKTVEPEVASRSEGAAMTATMSDSQQRGTTAVESRDATVEYPQAITIKAISDRQQQQQQPSEEEVEDTPSRALRLRASQKIQLQRSRDEPTASVTFMTTSPTSRPRKGGILGFLSRLLRRSKE